MSVLNLSGDEAPECPLCMEFFELDDINFYPCTCGYQICRFCWNKLRTEGNGLCPACRTPYTENPADFKPLTSEEMAKIKAEKRQKDQAKKQKITENRKHLANVRVVQKNLVFVVGLSPRLADPEVLKKPDYFGKFGKIHKVVINHSTQYAGTQVQGPSASAYVTYLRSEDALRAIQAVNNIFIDGRTLKASLGTTKYCSHFMKNQGCPKGDCMYLHEMGDEHASFTKEQMQQGKHTEYEKSLHEEMLSSGQPPSSSPELGGGVGEGEWSSHWGTTPRVSGGPDHWGGGTEEWGERQGSSGDQTWPDLGGLPPYKGRSNDKSKSKSCSSSDLDSLGAEERGEASDQVVPEHGPSGHTPGLADAAWEDRDIDSELSRELSRDTQPVSPEPVQPDQEPEPQHESGGWLDSDLKSSNTFLDDDDVDDLGFDPFHETQKGLADLLESEAAAQAQQQAQVSSPSPDWRGQAPPSRVKLPPPGFHNSSAAQHLPPNNLGGNFNQGFGGGLNLPPSSSSAVDSLFGLSRGRSGPAPGFGGHQGGHGGQDFGQLLGLGAKTGGLDIGSGRLGLGGLGLGDRLYGEQKPNHLGHHLQDNGFNKDWQDGLRALLPNVNVSFGGNNHNNSQGHFGLQNVHQQQQQQFSQQQQQEARQQQQLHSGGWGSGLTNGLGNDWTMLDPAIVSGGGVMANNVEQGLNHLAAARADSPPNWMTANLEQLTGEGGQYSGQASNLIPAFNGLGLGDRMDRMGPASRQPRFPSGGGGWGAGVPPPATTATPPPGFSHHRQNLGHQQYQGFPGNVSKGSEAHKIGEF